MKLITILTTFLILLTACGGNQQQIESEQQIDDVQTISETTNEIIEQPTETEKQLTGSGESTAFSPYTSTAQVTIEGEDIIDVQFEEFLEDGTSKNVASKEGTYTSPNYTLGEFYEQIDSLEAYVIENDEFPKLTNGTDVDGVTGASVNLSGFEEAFNQAITNAK